MPKGTHVVWTEPTMRAKQGGIPLINGSGLIDGVLLINGVGCVGHRRFFRVEREEFKMQTR
ncbi:hypothetical protein Pla52n_49260 [Stieleria varia]|uniref:Uncharacterized protein n=1 Tax=Stieleria varia TaxID=2528005 RepID=A0A5C6AJN5_9BACT|nr:hypothetical protein Pla52n_49260 [Stieleria varia]